MKKTSDAIDSSVSVSVHIRRGDYVTNRHTNAVHGVCPLSYYKKAMKFIEDRVAQPEYFVFSDDLDWVKGNLQTHSKVRFVDNNRESNSYNDMHLMSLCKHSIIANSSFSWWGAWLGGNKDKIVVAPSQWFRDRELDSSDHIPSSWYRM